MQLRTAALCLAAMVVLTRQVPSQIIINEIMQNPDFIDDTNGEWFELYNAGDDPVDINGWTIRDDGSNHHVIDNGGPLIADPGNYLVLGRHTDPLINGNVPVAYAYGSDVTLGNGADQIIIEDGSGREVDRVAYDDGKTFPDPTGASMELVHFGLDNADGTHWAEALTAWSGQDRGTPGAVNSQLDSLPPDLIAVTATSPELLTVTFSEAVDESSAVTTSNYTITPGAGHPLSASPDPTDGSRVQLTVLPLLEGTEYVLHTEGIQDRAGNVSGPDSVAFQLSAPILPGDIIVTEIMNDPQAVNDADGEWFEVFNMRTTPVDLGGWIVTDGGANTFTIGTSFIIPPGGFGVLTVNGDSSTNGGFGGVPVYDWGSSGTFTLGNTSDKIILLYDTVVIDSVSYDGGTNWPDPTGASMGLSDFSLDNNIGANWTIATVREPSFDSTGGDLGSPGALGSNQHTPSPQDLSGEIRIPKEFLPVPASGDTVEIELVLCNTSGETRAGDAWALLLRPESETVRQIIAPHPFSLASGDSLKRIRHLRIPDFGPAGQYRLVLHAGIFPDSIAVADTFFFEKSGVEKPVTVHSLHVSGLPERNVLSQNFPNPFNSSATIQFGLTARTWVTIRIYDLLGREIRTLMNGFADAGFGTVRWDGTDNRGRPAGSGVYIYRIRSEGFSDSRRMIMLK